MKPGGLSTRTRSTTGNISFYKLDDSKKATLATQIKKKRPESCYQVDYEIGACLVQAINQRGGTSLRQIALNGMSRPLPSVDAMSHNQMGLRKGLEKFAERTEDAVKKEFAQFRRQEVLLPKFAAALSEIERKEALRLIMTIKEKRNGTVKARACADGRSLRGKIRPEDASSPTVSSEAFSMTCAIDAKENRVVATCDVSEAYLHCMMDELCHVLLEGEMVDLYLEVDPSASKKVTTDSRGRKKLYTRMNKALYGYMRSGRLFWQNFSAKLKSLGFASNPDDLCVMNKWYGDDQFTILLHVDDLKLSFAREKEINDVLRALEEEYGKLEIQRGKVLEFLGLTLDYRTKGVCKIGAGSYIRKAIDSYEGFVKGKAKTPAGDNLFNIRDDAALLEEGERKKFHSNFALLLWTATMARPDILVPISFLGKRTTKADVFDREKLLRLLSYLEGTIEMKLTLGADDLHVIKWWADSSFAVHPDMKSHSGLFGTLGRGAIFAKSTTQKLNTTSSTESEVVASSEALTQALWTTSFLKHQGYDVKTALLHQGNQTAILLQKNGVMSRRKRSRHINKILLHQGQN